MRLSRLALAAPIAVLAAALAACGGGSTGTSAVPSGGNGGGSGSGGGGTNAAPLAAVAFDTSRVPAGSSVTFSCGCTNQAGTTTVGGDGSVALPASAPATPPSPNPTYTTVPGRNYLVVATAPSRAESWTLVQAGSSAGAAQLLGGSGSVDAYATLAALYVYARTPAGGSSQEFDVWNFGAISTWVGKLRGGAVTSADQKALADIAAAQSAGATLYPFPPPWNPGSGSNAGLGADMAAIANGGDPNAPHL